MQLLLEPAPPTRPPALVVAQSPRPDAQPMLPLPAAEEVSWPDPLSPEHERAARALCSALVEVLAGRRPVTQLRGAMPAGALRLVSRLASAGGATGLRLAALRLQGPDAWTAEAALRIADSARSRAAAVRLERRAGGWRLVALEVALDPGPVSRWPRGAS